MLIWKSTHEREMAVLRAQLASVQEESRAKGIAIANARAETAGLLRRLSQIASLETPNCAHIGKKMAKVARGEA